MAHPSTRNRPLLARKQASEASMSERMRAIDKLFLYTLYRGGNSRGVTLKHSCMDRVRTPASKRYRSPSLHDLNVVPSPASAFSRPSSNVYGTIRYGGSQTCRHDEAGSRRSHNDRGLVDHLRRRRLPASCRPTTRRWHRPRRCIVMRRLGMCSGNQDVFGTLLLTASGTFVHNDRNECCW
jgi:hypothetical protein